MVGLARGTDPFDPCRRHPSELAVYKRVYLVIHLVIHITICNTPPIYQNTTRFISKMSDVCRVGATASCALIRMAGAGRARAKAPRLVYASDTARMPSRRCCAGSARPLPRFVGCSDPRRSEGITLFNVAKSGVIVRVRGPLVRWERRQPARCLRADRAPADGRCGKLAFRRFLSVFTVLSSRSVRRHNATAARASIAVHTDEVASLLP